MCLFLAVTLVKNAEAYETPLPPPGDTPKDLLKMATKEDEFVYNCQECKFPHGYFTINRHKSSRSVSEACGTNANGCIEPNVRIIGDMAFIVIHTNQSELVLNHEIGHGWCVMKTGSYVFHYQQTRFQPQRMMYGGCQELTGKQ